MGITIKTIPEKKEDKETNFKVRNIVEDRNKIIAKKFNIEPLDVNVHLYYVTSQLVSKVGSHDERLGVFSGYVDYEDVINIAHPIAIKPIFSENLDKQLSIMIDYTLLKMYLCKIYYPKEEDFKLYYKYLSDVIAKLISGNYVTSWIEYEILKYNENLRYKKDLELLMILYVMLEKSGYDFIYSNLDTFFKDCNIKKSIMKIYKKDYKELINLYKKEKLQEQKELKKVK
ncbi:MAG: hypothetical protein ACOC16_01160 [Nanoarchaeota archaeon]